MPVAAPEPISARDARRIALAGQGLLGPRPAGNPAAVLRRLRAVQLDTISVLARSHQLVAYARLGPVTAQKVESAYWAGPPFGAFEYWAHAACILPMEDWPFYEFQRHARRERGHRWHKLDNTYEACKIILDRLRSDGPLTANELGGAKKGGPWWDWSDTKIAVEWLLDIGEVVCAKRRGFQRVYDLPDRAVPAELLEITIEPDHQMLHLLRQAARALGVATARDLATYTGVKSAVVSSLAGDLGLVPVAVEGWRTPAWAVSEMLEAGTAGLRSRPTLLSPFDSLVWDRDRVERLFGFRHRLEAYTPSSKRIYGYFAMPVLVGDRLVGRVDPGRDGNTLVAKNVNLEPFASAATVRGLASALRKAASWVGSDDIRVENVAPEDRRAEVLEAVGSARA
ncbi:MAG: winged helix-turn-helix domain-containing protein [Acidimicrobiales bacterium]